MMNTILAEKYKPLNVRELTELIKDHQAGDVSDSQFQIAILTFKDQMGGFTPMDSAHKNDIKSLKYVLEFAKNQGFLDKIEALRGPYYRATLIHIAINGHSEDAVKILVETFPNLVKVPNSRGTTPKTYAMCEFPRVANLL